MKQAASKHLRRAVAYALFAGAIAAPFTASPAYALPVEGGNAAANAAEATITQSGTVMDINGKTLNNVLRWEDFSIDAGEKVRFDGAAHGRNYLNLVTSAAVSRIYGTIEGGNNVYLVNSNGILFAESAQVNTGALYLSTMDISAIPFSVYRGGTILSRQATSMARC